MAEYCLECLNKYSAHKYRRIEVVLSRELDLCEGCGAWKRTVIRIRYCFFSHL